MDLHIKKSTARRITETGLLLALGLVLHYGESMIPVFHVLPGGKLGLANLVTLVAFARGGWSFALTVGLLRCFLGGVLQGSVTMIFYGASGTFLSVLFMAFLKHRFPHSVTTVGRSILGAVSFNVGQILVCALVLKTVYIFSYLPVLMVLGGFSGLLTGFMARQVEAINM